MGILATVVGPHRSIDLEMPAETPIRDLIPVLLHIQGAALGNRLLDGPQVWGLGFPETEPFPPQRSLLESGVPDGAVLILRDATYWRRQRDSATPRSTAPRATSGGIGVTFTPTDFTADH
jgi:WXG100 protein secretion system (Wss), protein YukD